MSADPVDPWAVIEAVFPKAKPNPTPRSAVILGSAAPDTHYAAVALDNEAQAVLDAPRPTAGSGGGRNDALNRAAFNLGQLVAGGALDEADVVHTLTHVAQQAGLDDDEIFVTIRSGLRAGAESPRGVPEPVDIDGWVRSLPDNARVGPATGAVIEETPEEAEARRHSYRVGLTLADLRAKHDAKLAHQAELAAKHFREPPSVFTLTEELQIPDEPISYAIDDLLPTGGNALLTAAYKSGKTTLVTNLLRAYADGEPFLGKFGVNPGNGRIAIFNYELSPAQYRIWLRDAGIHNTDRVAVLHLRGHRLPITAPTIEDWIVRWLTDRDVSVWIADPFARAATGTDENSNTDVGVWLDTFDVIKNRAGVSEGILPTHTGRAEQEHGQERARGATRLDDWADVRWILTADEDGHRFFRATGRDVEIGEELLTFDEGNRRLTYGGGDRRWVRNRGLQQRVLDYINANPGCGIKAIQTGVTGNKGDIDGVRLDLIARHKVRVEDAPRNGQNHYANEEKA